MLSVIVPTYNERKNLPTLLSELILTLNQTAEPYEIIVIDDHSTDGSLEYLKSIQKYLPVVKPFLKTGLKGKGYSLLEGFKLSKGGKIAMIDADLQYQPQAIPKMVKKLTDFDIVVGNRITPKRDFSLRRLLSRIYKNVFGFVLLGIQADVQSGLKVFRRAVLHNLRIAPSKWGFDYEFLFKAQRMGWKIGQTDIIFLRRASGESSINLFFDGFVLAWGAFSLRLKYIFLSVLKFLDYPHHSEKNPVEFSNTKDYLFLPEIYSAKKHIYAETVSFAFTAGLFGLGGLELGKRLGGISFLVFLSGVLSLFYLVIMLFKIFVVYKSFRRKFIAFSKKEVAQIDESTLPTFTILIPLYQEQEVVKQIKKAMLAIDYPPDKLDIIITLEEYDLETIEAIKKAGFPSHFRTLILPNVTPKTKPKALNVALLEAKGEFLVIYDAEIIPEPDQLKKAVLAFSKYPEISVLQTRLDHYNASQNILTKFFNAEFSFHFDLFLPGLQKMGYPIPLSGHSTIFRTAAIKNAGGWDPYNVTEDCDLGIRLSRMGYKVDILDSISFEEATSTISSWINQRSRWIKGFIQTSIVHLRHPFRFKNEIGGWQNFFAFLLTVPASVVVNLFNLVFWGLLVAWIFTRSAFITSLFPGPIFYISLVSFLVGNFIFIYLNLVGAYMRGRYEFVKYNLLSPVYWLLLAVATIKAVWDLLTKPHHWSKTRHGTHLSEKEESVTLRDYAVKPG